MLATRIVGQGIRLDGPDPVTAKIHDQLTFRFAIENTGALTDTFDLSLVNAPGTHFANPRLLLDADQDGSADDNIVIDQISLAGGRIAGLLFTTTVPGSAVGGDRLELILTATSQSDPTRTARASAVVDITGGGLRITSRQALDPACDGGPGNDEANFGTDTLTIRPGQCLRYFVTLESIGNGPAYQTSLQLVVPAGTVCHGYCSLAVRDQDGNGALDINDQPERHQAGSFVLGFGDLAPAETRTIFYTVRLSEFAKPGTLLRMAPQVSYSKTGIFGHVTETGNAVQAAVVEAHVELSGSNVRSRADHALNLAFTLTNRQSVADVFSLEADNAGNDDGDFVPPFTLYQDQNGNGDLDPAKRSAEPQRRSRRDLRVPCAHPQLQLAAHRAGRQPLRPERHRIEPERREHSRRRDRHRHHVGGSRDTGAWLFLRLRPRRNLRRRAGRSLRARPRPRGRPRPVHRLPLRR